MLPNSSFNAEDWARAWMAVKVERSELGSDFGEMVQWFANSLVTGYDEGYNAARRQFIDVLQRIMNELGVPQPEYPQPVVNAYEIADAEMRRINPDYHTGEAYGTQ